MSVLRTHFAPLVALLAAATTCADPARAQVPEGSAVIGTYTEPGVATSGRPGLFLVSLAGDQMTPVTGLPPELSTDGLGKYGQGAWSVSIRSADGAVIVGTVSGTLAPGGAQGWLFVLFLNGAAVDPARSQKIALGATINVARVWNAVLPDGRILVAGGGDGVPFTSGPMTGHFLAIVDTSGPAPAFTLLPTPLLPAVVLLGGIAVDPSGSFLYYLLSDGFFRALTDAHLRRYDLASGQDCLIATITGQTAYGIRCDDDGTVYVGATDPVAKTHFIHTVRPGGCGSATVTMVQSSLPLIAAGLDLDRTSGRFAATSDRSRLGLTGHQINALSLIDRASGTVTVIASAPAGGWGTMGTSSVAVNNPIESYGARSDGQNHYWFDNFPNPGGQPTLGNRSFSLTMAAAPNVPLASALWFSSGRGSTHLLGVEILVDLASTVGVPVLTGSSVPIALPIPGDPALRGLVLTAQSLHLEANPNRLAASRGLTLTVQ